MNISPRRTGIASVATLGGISLTLIFVHTIGPGWARTSGLDVWTFGRSMVDYRDTITRAEAIDAAQDQLTQQVTASEQTVSLLVAGIIDLPEAVAELDQINREREGFPILLASVHPQAPSYRARLARYAITKVRNRLETDPSPGTAVLDHLEAEYRVLVGAEHGSDGGAR